MAGPVLFTVAWLVAASVQDDYSARREDISALAAVDAQHAWIVMTGIIALGLGIIALGLGLRGVSDDGRSAKVGTHSARSWRRQFCGCGFGAQRLQFGVAGV